MIYNGELHSTKYASKGCKDCNSCLSNICWMLLKAILSSEGSLLDNDASYQRLAPDMIPQLAIIFVW